VISLPLRLPHRGLFAKIVLTLQDLLVIFIHGYSVSGIETYGELPLRLINDGPAKGFRPRLHDLYLARYISFNDEVRLDDLSRALESALKAEIYARYPEKRFVCITHSTGGPLVRNWLRLFHSGIKGICPLSHLVMLAPPNHGSALAQLGKTRLGRVRAWFNGMEPGQKILDWLELGSRGSWELSKQNVMLGNYWMKKGVFQFVLTGQDIDRRIYDHINSYTGEVGSDGVVRAASANLNNAWIRLEQDKTNGTGQSALRIADFKRMTAVPFRILRNKSHSNEVMGIMRSVKADGGNDPGNADTLEATFRCLAVSTDQQYKALAKVFEKETHEIQLSSAVEVEQKLNGAHYHIHDRQTMLIFRFRDSEGHAVRDYDLLLTAGPSSDPDALPQGFFTDRQCNCKDNATLTYFLNYDVLKGCPEVKTTEGQVLRPARPGITSMGLTVISRPSSGLVHFETAVLPASEDFFNKVVRPNETTLVEIIIRRVLSGDVLRLGTLESTPDSWKV
jgi:hypothetical protein